ncbi:MAG: hypothetical protein ACRBCI_09760 [Cellvibrionaceae bacterium]
MKGILLLLLFTLSCFSYAEQGKIYISYPDDKASYKDIANTIEEKLGKNKVVKGQNFSIETHKSSTIKERINTKKSLVIQLGNDEKRLTQEGILNQPIIHIFSTLQNHETLKKERRQNNFISIVLDQPLQIIINKASKTVKNNYKNKIIISVSESNTGILDQISDLKPLDKGEIIVVKIKDDEVAAKAIEKHLFNAAALVAIRDDHVWSRKNASWMLRQAYNYQVPVIGYSQAFLKAGAMISIYSSNEDIITQTIKSTEQWIRTQELQRESVIYPKHTLKVNKNIAAALKFNPDTLEEKKEAENDI